MVIENMRFTLQPDGKLDMKFRCLDCQKWMDKPDVRLHPYRSSILWDEFLCFDCARERRRKQKREEEERLRNRTPWQKFRDFWI